MDDVEAALRALSAVITRRDDGKCGRLNAINKKPCDNDLKIRVACSRHATEEEQRLNNLIKQVHSLGLRVRRTRQYLG
jgi:hypothetical protein